MKYTKAFFFLSIFNQAICQGVNFTAEEVSKTCSGTTMKFDSAFTLAEISATEYNFNNSNDLPTGWDSSDFTIGTPCNSPKGPRNPADNNKYFWAVVREPNFPGPSRFVQTSEVYFCF